MNKFACLLLLPFALTQPLTPGTARAATPPLGQIVLPAAPAAAWPLLAARWRGPAAARPSAIRALGRLLRAYTEPARPDLRTGESTSAQAGPDCGRWA